MITEQIKRLIDSKDPANRKLALHLAKSQGCLDEVVNGLKNPVDWIIKLLDESQQRNFACDCVEFAPLGDGRKVWDLLTDERDRESVRVARRYANGKASDEELSDAHQAASDVPYLDESYAAFVTTLSWASNAAWTASDATKNLVAGDVHIQFALNRFFLSPDEALQANQKLGQEWDENAKKQ